MYKAFIEPDLKTAHIKIINKFNPFSGFQNPIYILKVKLPFTRFFTLVICNLKSPNGLVFKTLSAFVIVVN